MSQPFDLSQFPNLPPEVVKAFAAELCPKVGDGLIRRL
jgi:hypothetical protein